MKFRSHQNRRTLRTGHAYKAEAIMELIKDGWNVRKRGWPDLIVSKGEFVQCVYIQKPGHQLSEAQTEVLILLRRAGISVGIRLGVGGKAGS